MAAEIHVTVEVDGSVRIEARGVVGQGCAELTGWLERELGLERAKVTHKPEWNQAPQMAQKVKVGR